MPEGMTELDRTAFGRVHLVGAGPGDPELLTLRAHRLIAGAEAVVFDRLVAPAILDLIPPAALRFDVGKLPGWHRVPQEEINALLAALARRGLEVVRLKGGDPLIFGRGSEEAEHLRRHGIQCDVVPGITSAAGCAALLGVPLTHRGLAQGVRYVTGHCQGDRPLDLNWASLADPDTTLVVYMGLAQIGRIAERLIAAGLPAATPVMAVQNGTTPRQRHLIARLDGIAEVVAPLREGSGGGAGPVLFIIGRVVALAAPQEISHAHAPALA